MYELFAYGDAGWGDEILRGLAITAQLAIVTLPVGLALGFLAAFCSLSQLRTLRFFGFGYTTVMRGLPEILTLFVVYNGVGLLLNSALRWWNPDGGGTNFSPFAAGVIALGMVFGAFAGEVIRGAFNSLDRGQAEAGRAIGMSQRKIFFRIQLPQLWRFALPGLGNLWINMLKDTALVSVIALDDLMRMTKVAVGVTKQPFTFYLVACLIYWVLCLLSEVVLARMEKRANRGVRRA
ncbi:ABC transporter permease [Thalassobacter stenotrophicus]|jgi:polar amino acid transport system permease protein|uniref:ABC transporter permease n=1 Tax=Roseobacteraceae TaxID=2854170 RepID=UPI00051F9FA5|nr:MULTISPECIES: ABC transporter permease [Roseobacteraceae]KGK78081.1 ABC transporter permease [Thalassobacter stenotrophicus]MDB4164528.1 ABC transporter permease [bacterium]MDB9946033.1 ABC transporter permease [Ascidiaceihabitans sp.]WIF33242.1 putative histidine transport system permease protein HisQ [Lentibacter algarum]